MDNAAEDPKKWDGRMIHGTQPGICRAAPEQRDGAYSPADQAAQSMPVCRERAAWEQWLKAGPGRSSA